MPKSNNVVRLVRSSPAPKRARPRVNTISHSQASKGYRFIEKDPVLERLVDLIEQSPLTYKEICDSSGVSWQTIRNWRTGKTKKPQNVTMDFVARAIGYRRGDWARI